MNEKQFLQERFSEYYEDHKVNSPPNIEEREFGGGVEQKINFRHLSFPNKRMLNAYLRNTTPLFISFSAAYYQFPEKRPMKNKNWKGADLIFDLDADEFKTSCEHSPDMVCENCLEVVKQELIKIIEEYLVPDFGFSKNKIKTFFSGNRGYHMHIRTEDVRHLGKEARAEITDYITASGLDLEKIGLFKDKNKKIHGPKPEDGGWANKVSTELIKWIKEMNAKQFSEKTGLSRAVTRKLFNSKQETINTIKTGVWGRINLSMDSWEQVAQAVVQEKAAEIDKHVTSDISRLLRVPGTLHGGTGLVACEVNNLDDFNPLKDAVVFGEKPYVVVPNQDVAFVFDDQTFELEKGKRTELPEKAAVFAIGKKLGGIRNGF